MNQDIYLILFEIKKNYRRNVGICLINPSKKIYYISHLSILYMDFYMYVLNWLSFFFFFLVVADFFCFKVGYTQCLAIATGNFFFFGFILMCCNLIALETKLLCLLGVIICDIKNKIRNNRQVPTYFRDLCSFQVFFPILFIFYFFMDKWIFMKESNFVRLCWWMAFL